MTPKEEVLLMARIEGAARETGDPITLALAVARYAERRALERAGAEWRNGPAYVVNLPSEYE